MMNDAASRSLAELITEHGVELAEDPRRLEAFLRDYCPECRREIFAIMAAGRAGIPSQLTAPGRESGLGLTDAALSRHLEEDYGLSADVARWAVGAWAHALGLGASLETGPPPPYLKASKEPAPIVSVLGEDTRPRVAIPNGLPQQPTLRRQELQAPEYPVRPPDRPARPGTNPAPRRATRRLKVLAIAGLVAFLIALAAGALYGRALLPSEEGGGASAATARTTVYSAATSPTSTTFESTTTTGIPTTTFPAQVLLATSTTTGSTIATTTTKAGTATSLLTQTERVVCTPYGATIEIPEGWSTTGLFTDWAGGKTLLAYGPNDSLIRVDALLKGEGTTLETQADRQESDVKRNHSDYVLVSRQRIPFAGTDAIEWRYHFEVRDAGPSDYRTIYLDPNSTGIVARFLTSASEAEKLVVLQIQESFTLPPELLPQ